MPTIPYHHLYDIHILVIISRRVVDAFGPCFLSLSFMLAVCFPLPTPITLRTFLSLSSVLELGRRERTAQVSRSFFVLFTLIFTW
jgi:hypothetical protein